MRTDTPQIQRLAPAMGVSSVFPADTPVSSTALENFGTGIFGPAYVRERQRPSGNEFPVYGANGMLRSNTLPPGEEQLIDARAVRALEARDKVVRQREHGKGEAVIDSNYIYQTGPDGKRYAIGTRSHTVRPEQNDSMKGTMQTETPIHGADGEPLSREDAVLLEKLKERDAKVRNHEAEHIMAAGGQAHGLPTYTYQTGPDGRQYAIGGSVNISMLTTGDAKHDARQALTAYRAAMATGEPSSQDMQTAMKARAHAAEALMSQQEQEAGV